MDKQELYDSISARKSCDEHYQPYKGGNGRIDRVVELFNNNKLSGGDVLLDVGGSIGDLGYALRDKFKKRITLDINEQVLKAARNKGNEVLCCDIEKTGIKLADESVDFIAALDVIEHFIDVNIFVKECYRVLKKNSKVIINTPNIQFFKHIEQIISGKFPSTSGDKETYWGGHTSYWCYDNLIEIFSMFGFSEFEQIMDESGFVQPPESWIKTQKVSNKQEYINACMKFGNSNLIFLATKII